MKRTLRYSLALSLLTILAACLAVVLVCARRERAMTACNSLKVEFRDSLGFVSEGDIQRYLEHRYGPYIGQRLDSIGLGRIEQLLEEKNIVTDCQAWTTDDGTLHVSIAQRTPVLRFADGDKGFYMDAQGYTFPLHKSYTAPVRVISGGLPQVSEEDCGRWKEGLLELIGEIDCSLTWKGMVEDISVMKNGDLILKVKDGKERFLFGWPDGLKDKLARMDNYCKIIAPAAEEQYKSVNLKYNNQIICRKDI